MRILVVEDQKKVASFLKKGLSEQGYMVDLAESGESAELLAGEYDYDLIILDVMLPGQTGFDTARHLRAHGYAAPILMLTALSGTKDKVSGLDSGADDYLVKPFEFVELLARVRALLRRRGQAVVSNLRYHNLELDVQTRKATRSGATLDLTQREFALLEYFMRNPERPLSRTSIGENVWDIHFDFESNVIDVYVNMLRKKMGGERLIHTVTGVGYILNEGAKE